jgi:AraC-like DNA-binding protein
MLLEDMATIERSCNPNHRAMSHHLTERLIPIFGVAKSAFMGVSVSEYIQQLKIDAAKNMLLYSDFSPARISSILAFPDQSYFTQVFKKYTGLTPRKFQSVHLREISLH